MKKILSVFIVLVLSLSVLTACGGNSAKEVEIEKKVETEKKVESVTLTKENIGDYLAVSGEYKNGDYHSSILYYISTADLDFKAYSTVAGSFSNVEITVRADLSEKTGTLNEKWHMVDSDDKSKVEFTFKMPANGDYSTSYSIECDRATWSLSGSAKLEIVSVSGTFTPNN